MSHDIEPGCCEWCNLALAEDALLRVEKLHVRVSSQFGPDYCEHCRDGYGGREEWPCATIRAIDGGAL